MMMGGGYGQQPQQPHPPPPTFDRTGTPTSIFNPAMAVPDPVGPPPTSGRSAPPGAQPMDRPNMMMPPHSAGPGWNDPPPSVMNTTAKKSAITKPTALADHERGAAPGRSRSLRHAAATVTATVLQSAHESRSARLLRLRSAAAATPAPAAGRHCDAGQLFSAAAAAAAGQLHDPGARAAAAAAAPAAAPAQGRAGAQGGPADPAGAPRPAEHLRRAEAEVHGGRQSPANSAQVGGRRQEVGDPLRQTEGARAHAGDPRLPPRPLLVS